MGRGPIDYIQQQLQSFSPDVFFHLAGRHYHESEENWLENTVESNFGFGMRVSRFLPKSTKIILAGSFWQFSEDGCEKANSTYAALKSAFHKYLEAEGFRVMTLVLFDVYGPNDTRKKLVNTLLYEDCKEMKVTQGEQFLDLVFVSDVCRAFLLAGTTSFVTSGFAAVSSGQRLTLRSLVQIVEDLRGEKLHLNWGSIPYPSHQIMRPVSCLPRLGDWDAVVPIREGLRRCLSNR